MPQIPKLTNSEQALLATYGNQKSHLPLHKLSPTQKNVVGNPVILIFFLTLF